MNTPSVSPLAPRQYCVMPPIDGLRLATAEAGIKYKGRRDLMVMVLDPGSTVSGVLTRSGCPSAPVEFCRANLSGGQARVLVVNSGNANAFTGVRGHDAAWMTANAAAKAVDCDPGEVFLASTGVIGEPLAADKFCGMLNELVKAAAPENWLDAAQAIMTTDTYPKVATASAMLEGVEVTLNGIAKGSGMIAPDMATMLSFLATDAPLDGPVLQSMLSSAVRDSFNAITVDSDTSTSDTLLLFATGAARSRSAPRISDPRDRRLAGFKRALKRVLKDLALQVVRDGEGATKLVEVTVTGAKSSRSARRVAFSIANSPLVKTAVAGEDANWGRVVMAVGKSGETADRDKLAIWYGDIKVADLGARHPGYSEEDCADYMKNEEIGIRVDLGVGRGKSTVWTCDLTKEYVAINGDYRS